MEDSTELVLTKNIWELEQQIAAGHANSRTRHMLLRSYSQHVDYMESQLDIPPEHRAFLKVREGQQDGVLLIHGSTGSPADLRPLAEALFEGGFSVYVLRLPGHHVDGVELEATPWMAAVTDAETRYRMLASCCANLYVVGYSFGGAIALNLQVKPRPRALALLAPALYPKLGWVQRLLVRLRIDRIGFIRRRLGWNAELLEAMESARAQDWWHATPTLGLMARDDERIDVSALNVLKAKARHRGSTIDWFAEGGHGFLHGAHQSDIHDRIVAFFREN